jgi:methionine sulfoxide reductase heme-binding subunit
MLEWPRLLTVRRMVGVTALAYGVIHLSLYALDQNFAFGTVVSEIVRRFYLTIGFVALVGLAALGVTSTDGAMRRMGRGWKRLHRLAYPIGALALLHFFIQAKANVSEPVCFAGFFVWLMLWRVLPMRWRSGWAVYPALAAVSAVATAGMEFAWYGLVRHINPWRLLAADETIRFGLRPAHIVALVTLAVAVLMIGRRLVPLMPIRLRRIGPLPSGSRSS